MDAIEDAAAELFARSGFEGVSLRDISAASGAQLGTLTYLYADKQELYDRILSKAVAQFEGVLLEAACQEGTPLERLRSFVAALVRVHAARTTYGQIIARETIDGAESRLVVLGSETFQRMRQAINPLVTELVAEVASEAEASRITGRMINMVYAAIRGESLYATALGLEPLSIDTLTEQLTDMVLHGVLRR